MTKYLSVHRHPISECVEVMNLFGEKYQELKKRLKFLTNSTTITNNMQYKPVGNIRI